MATEFRASAPVIRHDNHTAPASLTERTFTGKANFLLIYNSHATLAASVSFDGTNEFPIPALGTFSAEMCRQKSYWTKGSGAEALKVLVGSED